MRIILASASPRRKELLHQMGLKFDVVPSDIEEYLPSGLSCQQVVQELALQKAANVAAQIHEQGVVIGADTIVVKDKILGKPKDRNEAGRMLQELQGRTHEVITGLALIDPLTGKTRKSFERTLVEMAPLSTHEIEQYIKTGEPMDKAGAYGIQGLAGIFISKISGCYYNVVGLPINRLWIMLKEFGISLL